MVLSELEHRVKNNFVEILILFILAPISLILSSMNFLLFHTLIELFSISVAVSLFLIILNTRKFGTNSVIHFLGTALFFVSLIDFFHLLTYRGIGIFNVTANVPTQLWIAARYLQSISFLMAIVLYDKIIAIKDFHKVYITYSIITGLLFFSIMLGLFPDCYLASAGGLTPFKIISEYIIISLLFSTILIYHFQHSKQLFDNTTSLLLAMMVGFTILSELAFTFYIDVYGLSNIIGHIFKIYAFYILYRVIIAKNLHNPYQILFHDLKKKEQAVQHEKSELKKSNKLLEDFASIVAHDIKSPLYTANLGLQMLEKDSNLSQEKKHELIERIGHKLEEVEQLMEDILQYSKATSGEITPSNPQSVVGRIKSDLSIENDKDIEIRTVNIPERVMCNETQLFQIFSNLIYNAIKHNDKDQVKINIIAQSIPEKNKYLFSVQDNGPGIEERLLDKLFQPFIRGKTKKSGTGLGLAIVKKLIDNNDGKIWVESERNKGTTVYFTLPAT